MINKKQALPLFFCCRCKGVVVLVFNDSTFPILYLLIIQTMHGFILFKKVAAIYE